MLFLMASGLYGSATPPVCLVVPDSGDSGPIVGHSEVESRQSGSLN